MIRSAFHKKLLVASILFVGVLLTAPLFAQAAQTWSQDWGYLQCTRHCSSINPFCDSDKFCDDDAIGGPVYMPAGYAEYSVDYYLTGHRHGGSRIWSEVCLEPTSGGGGTCWGFWGSGNQLGEEFGDVHLFGCANCLNYSNSLSSGEPVLQCWPTEWDNEGNVIQEECDYVPQGNYAGGARVEFWVYVQDAEARLSGTAKATKPDDPEPINYYYACSNNSCVQRQGDEESTCSSNADCTRLTCVNNSCTLVPGTGSDTCSPVGSSCGGPAGRKKCVSGNQCQFVAGDIGPDQCTTDANCAPSPTHFECVSESCEEVPGVGNDECDSDPDCAPATHKECQSQACVTVSGAGPDKCSTNANCTLSPRHKVCQGNACVTVNGPGPDACSTNADCAPPSTHKVCQNWSCVTVSGPGTNECSSNSECLPPPPTCNFSASPSRIVIPPPRSVQLSWSCQNAESCSISPSVGSVNPSSGTRSVTPGESTTYTIDCEGLGGFSSVSVDTAVRVFNFSGGKLKEITPR